MSERNASVGVASNSATTIMASSIGLITRTSGPEVVAGKSMKITSYTSRKCCTFRRMLSELRISLKLEIELLATIGSIAGFGRLFSSTAWSIRELPARSSTDRAATRRRVR